MAEIVHSLYNNGTYADFEIRYFGLEIYGENNAPKTIKCHKAIVLTASELLRDLHSSYPDEPYVYIDTRLYEPITVKAVIAAMYQVDIEPSTLSALVECIKFADYLNAPAISRNFIDKVRKFPGRFGITSLINAFELSVRLDDIDMQNDIYDLFRIDLNQVARKIIPRLIPKYGFVLARFIRKVKLQPIDEFMLRYLSREADPGQFATYLQLVDFANFGANNIKAIAQLEYFRNTPSLIGMLTSLAHYVHRDERGTIDVTD